MLGELLLEGGDLAGVQLVEVTAHTTVDDGDLPMYSQLTTVLIHSASDQPTLIYCNVNQENGFRVINIFSKNLA